MKDGRVVIIGDCHHPAVDKRLWNLALDLVANEQPDVTVQIGDFADNESVGRHAKRFGYVPDFGAAHKHVQKAAADLEEACGSGARGLVITLGNHDMWFPKYIAEKAPMAESVMPDFHKLYGFSPETRIVPYQQIHFIGKVGYVHDQGYSGTNATRQTLDAAGHCIVHGHDHRATIAYNGTSDGDRWVGMGVGWVGDESKISYAPPSRTRQWQKGVGVVDYVDGLAYAQFVPYVKKRLVLDGVVYK